MGVIRETPTAQRSGQCCYGLWGLRLGMCGVRGSNHEPLPAARLEGLPKLCLWSVFPALFSKAIVHEERRGTAGMSSDENDNDNDMGNDAAAAAAATTTPSLPFFFSLLLLPLVVSETSPGYDPPCCASHPPGPPSWQASRDQDLRRFRPSNPQVHRNHPKKDGPRPPVQTTKRLYHPM